MLAWIGYHKDGLVLLIVLLIALAIVVNDLVANRGGVALTVMTIVFALFVTSTTWQLAHTKPDIVHETGTGKHKRTLIYFGPMQSDAEKHSRQLRSVWADYATDMLLVTPNRYNLDSRWVVNLTYQRAIELGNEEVVVIGASRGMRMAADFAVHAARHGRLLRLKYVAVDPVDGFGSMKQRSLAIGTSLLPANPILDGLLFWVPRAMHSPPPTEPGVDHRALEEHYEFGRNYPLSGFINDIRYMAWRCGGWPVELYGIEMRLLRAGHDSVINETGDQPLLDAFGAKPEHKRIIWEANHVDFENPRRWRESFKWALGSLYPTG